MDGLKDKLIFALYGRISSEKEDSTELAAISRHRAVMEEWINKNGFSIYEYYEDKLSGAKRQPRKAYLRMLKDAQENRFNAILVHELDRLTRDAQTWYNDIVLLKEKKIKLFSVMEGQINYDDILTDFKIMMAMAYSKQVRLKRLQERDTRLKNKRIFLKAPFGYIYLKGSKKYKINPLKAEIVKRLFIAKLEGKGNTYLSEVIADSEITRPGVIKLLKNPFYIGYRMFEEKNNIKNQQKLHIWREPHIPIITEDVFFKVNPLLRNLIISSTNTP